MLRDYLTDLFPDPRARHEREDALDRAADERRRAVRDRRRRVGAEARPAARARRTTCAGIRSASSSRWRCRSRCSRTKTDNPRAAVLGKTLDAATGKLLENGKSPSRRVGELDNRGSHFYLALYWAQALASDPELGAAFAPLAERLAADEETIVGELDEVQGEASIWAATTSSIASKTDAVMRPSETFNAAIETLSAKA